MFLWDIRRHYISFLFTGEWYALWLGDIIISYLLGSQLFNIGKHLSKMQFFSIDPSAYCHYRKAFIILPITHYLYEHLLNLRTLKFMYTCQTKSLSMLNKCTHYNLPLELNACAILCKVSDSHSFVWYGTNSIFEILVAFKTVLLHRTGAKTYDTSFVHIKCLSNKKKLGIKWFNLFFFMYKIIA